MAAPKKSTGDAQGQARGRANLIPWKPGQSGNPKGRARKIRSWDEFLDKVPMQKDGNPFVDIDGQPMNRDDMVMKAIWTTAMERGHRDHLRAGELIQAYRKGKPVDRMELTGYEGGPVEVAVDVRGSTTGEIRKRLALLEAAATARRSGAK